MHIQINDINPELHVKIQGLEPWLERIYVDFPTAPGCERPLLTADLDLVHEDSGLIRVAGLIEYAPQLRCSRCELPVSWPMRLEVAARFLPEQVNEPPRDRSLNRSDLDAYYIEQAQVDLETLINDLVQTEVPSQTYEACPTCRSTAHQDRIYTTSNAEDASPFAALKGLKLKN